jgi:hypothetical protein
MNQRNRKIYLIIISTISLLSTYQFIDVYTKFRFLLIDILNNLTQNAVIYMLFALFISITSYVAIIYNWNLLKKRQDLESNLLDEPESTKFKEIGWMYYMYLMFSLLLIGLGAFLIVTLQENYPIEKLPTGLLPYFIVLIISGLGIILLTDGIKIKRAIKADN